ncbi:MAG: hypothetical protein ABI442_05525, partial [Gemmatimonadaceae bacterium]
SATGLAAVYALFAVVALTMIPLELTTPDLLCATTVFVAFGAMLRLRNGAQHAGRNAIVLGAALGIGALAKSFMVPWAIVCLASLAVAMRRREMKAVFFAGVTWLLILAPWAAVLSHVAGHFTVGDAGRLTYAWYVNEQNPPSLGGVPVGARTPATDVILPGVGVPGDAMGTDPMWFDPGRWNRGVVPHLNVSQQMATLRVFVLFYIQNLTPLLFVVVLIVGAPRSVLKAAWRDSWVVLVPAAAGVAAYAVVLVTARYIMPFVLSGSLVALAVLPLPRRMTPVAAAVGLLIPAAIEAFSSTTILGLALVASIVGGVTVGVLVSSRSKTLWVSVVIVGLGVTRAVLSPADPVLLRVGTFAMLVVIFIAARAAIREKRPVLFARKLEAALGVTLALVLGLRLGLRLDQDARQANETASPAFGNVSLNIARDLETHGITPGTRIAVIGPHAESYWARAGRLRIVANVPRTLTGSFWALSAADRDALLDDFAAAGATVAIATIGPENAAPDSSWTPVRYQGWIRKLKR